MITLNLPTFEYKLKEDNGRYLIFDILRKRYIALTPGRVGSATFRELSHHIQRISGRKNRK